MSFIRGVFLFALVMLLVGAIGSRFLLSYLFGPPGSPDGTVAAVLHTPTPTSTPKPVHHAARHVATARPTATPTTAPTAHAAKPRPTATSTPLPTVAPAVRHIARRARSAAMHVRAAHAHAAPTSTPTPLPSPTPTPASGTITLVRYWVGSPAAQPGQTISIGYVIDNGTGHTARVTLGASIKSSHVLSWLSGEINDPYHDVVAVVPPGITTHIRFFTLPGRLHVGSYDVAWGLRNALDGAREALVAAPAALSVAK